MTETRLARFTEWFRRRPNSLEFWEVFVTDRRVVWCFVRESFSSMLLRADVGKRDREALGDRPIEELPAADERNFAVPLDSLERLELTRGTRVRRARLETAWTDGGSESTTLYNTKTGDPQEALIDRLEDHPAFEGVAVGVESPSSPTWRVGNSVRFRCRCRCCSATRRFATASTTAGRRSSSPTGRFPIPSGRWHPTVPP